MKLTEMISAFPEPTVQSMKDTIRTRIRNESVRLGMLKEVVGEMFDS